MDAAPILHDKRKPTDKADAGSSGGVVVIGSMSADVTAKASQLPKRGQTVMGSEFTLVSGGKGSNQAVMAAHMGTSTWMVGSVGNDVFRHVVEDSLRKHGVHTEYVAVLNGESTGIAHIRVDDSGDNDIVIVPHANRRTSSLQVDAFFADHQPVQVALLQLEIPIDTVLHAAMRAKERGLTVILDPAPALRLPTEIYQYVDIVTPNETEASILSGVDVHDLETARQAAEVFHQLGVPRVIITLGEKGVVVLDANDGSKTRHFPPFSVNVVDTTAAGDAFTGTLGACLAQGTQLTTAIRYAMAAGALAVTKMGAEACLPTLAEVEQLLREQQ